MRPLYGLLTLVLIQAVLSEPFLYTKYAHEMDSNFIGRRNGITFSDIKDANTLYVMYGTPNGTEPELVVQILSQAVGDPTVPSQFPPRPTETIYPIEEHVEFPEADRTVQAVSVGESTLFVVTVGYNGFMATLWSENDDPSDKMMTLITLDFRQIVSIPELQSFVYNESDTFISSVAVGGYGTDTPKVAVGVRFAQNILKVLIYNVTGAFMNIERVLDVPENNNTGLGLPALASYTSFGNHSFVLAYSYRVGVNSWNMAVRLINDQFNFVGFNSFAIESKREISLKLNTIGRKFIMTAKFVSVTGSILRQVVIDDAGESHGSIDLTTGTTVESFQFNTAILITGEIITVWCDKDDDVNIFGYATLLNHTTNQLQPYAQFTVPAATPTSAIGDLFVNPLSFSTFAMTQTVRGANPSSFVNYYVLSNCEDDIATINENCEAGHPGCVDCMCSEQTGWYSNGDGFTCSTQCGDRKVAGDESCDNPDDSDCVECTCAVDLEWNRVESLCMPPSVVESPVSSPVDGKPFDNNLIAIFVLVPVGVGAAIFFGVYFGRKRKSAKKQGGAVPLTTVRSDGKYSGIQASEATNTSNSVYSAVSAPPSSTADDKMRVPFAELKFQQEIGAGAYGKVLIGEWQRTKVALKINTLATGSEFEREAKLMVDLRPHPNVVQMLGVSSDGPYPVMILEFCDGGSLDTKLFDPTQPMTAADQLKIVSGIAKGLYHLHKNQIVHRDLAARNILLNFNQPKISDFGLSRLVNDSQKGTTRSNVGPIRWMAPESLKSMTYSTKSDVWSFGIVVYEIVARNEPHSDSDAMAIGLQIRDHGVTPSIPKDCDPCLKEIMAMCWQLDPENRPSMEQICDILDKYQHQ